MAVGLHWAPIVRWSLPTLLVQGALSALLFQDTLLAKHFFSAPDAGTYAGLATTARILAYGAMALATFLFPVVSRLQVTGVKGRIVTHITLGAVAAGEAVMLVVYGFFPAKVLAIVVGSQYSAQSALLPLVAIALASYALLTIIVNYLLASGKRLFWMILLVAPPLEVVLMGRYHTTLHDFILVEDLVILATLSLLLVIYLTSNVRINRDTGQLLASETIHSAV